MYNFLKDENKRLKLQIFTLYAFDSDKISSLNTFLLKYAYYIVKRQIVVLQIDRDF